MRTYDLNAEQGEARRRLEQHHLVAANSSGEQPTAENIWISTPKTS